MIEEYSDRLICKRRAPMNPATCPSQCAVVERDTEKRPSNFQQNFFCRGSGRQREANRGGSWAGMHRRLAYLRPLKHQGIWK